MPDARKFNPKAPLIVVKASGIKIGGRMIPQGEAVTDDCLSPRRRFQMFEQNLLTHPHLMETVTAQIEAVKPVEQEEVEPPVVTKEEEPVKVTKKTSRKNRKKTK